MTARARRLIALGLLTFASACQLRGSHAAATPTPVRPDWSATLGEAGREATAGRYASADLLLSEYAIRNPAASAATESIYWRALFKLDPANQAAAPREAVAMLDSYLATSAMEHRTEAALLRRLATGGDGRTTPTGAAGTLKDELPRAADKERDQELARLKDDLSKANAELERIRRRLAQPKP